MPVQEGSIEAVTVRVVRVIVWALCLVVTGISVLLIMLSPLWSSGSDTATRLADSLEAGTAIPFAWFGAIILTRRPGNRIGALLLLTALATTVVGVGAIGTRYALEHPYRPDAWVFAWIDSWSFIPLAGALLSLLLLFPTGKPVSPRWRLVLWMLVAWTILTGLVAALTPGIETEQGPSFDNPIGVPALAAQNLYQLPWLWFALFPVLMAASAISLATRFRRSRDAERQQLKWLIVAVALYLLSWMAWLPAGDWLWINVAAAVAGWGVPVAIGLAVLRYRLYDIDRIINRTLVYGLLTALLGGVYAVLVLILGQVFGGIGTKPPTWAVAGATLAVAALFQPARRRIQQAVDRRFNRRKYNAVKTIEAFSTRLREHVDLDTLSTELVSVVDQTMQPTQASLWLRPSAQLPASGRGREG